MMRLTFRQAIGLYAIVAGLAAAAIGGCGGENGDVPDRAVAKVGDRVITRAAVQRAMVGAIAIQHSAETMPPYLPADVEGCIAAKSRGAAARGASRDELRERCEQERDRAQTAAQRLLIQGEWYRLEARRRRLQVPAGDGGATAAEHAGVKAAYLRDVVRVHGWLFAVGPRPSAEPKPHSQAAIAAYYKEHRKRYITDDKRFISAVATRTRAQAERAASELKRGRDPKRIVEQAQSKDVTLPFEGPLITLLAGDARLQRAARRVPRGDVAILKNPPGWFVFRVDTVLLPEQQSLAEATSLVTQDLDVRRTKEDRERYNERLGSRYEEDTVCADGHEVPECT